MSGDLPLGALAPLLFATVTSALCAALYPLLRRRLSNIEPSARSRLIRLVVAAPLAGAFLLTALAFTPSLVAALWPALDHCLRHGDAEHPHLCFVHPSGAAISQAGWLIAAAALGALLVLVGQRVMRLAVASSVLRRLGSAARRHVALDAYVVDSAVPFAFTGGALDVRVFLSSSLLEALEPAQIEAVAAHERHHMHGRHPLWRGAVSLAACLHAPWVRRALVRDFELATEQACDEVAARHIGNRPLVAKTILDVSRLGSSARHAATAFGRDHVTERVESLLRTHAWVPAWRVSALAWVALVLIALVLSEPIHHLAESVLGLLAS